MGFYGVGRIYDVYFLAINFPVPAFNDEVFTSRALFRMILRLEAMVYDTDTVVVAIREHPHP